MVSKKRLLQCALLFVVVVMLGISSAAMRPRGDYSGIWDPWSDICWETNPTSCTVIVIH